MTASDPIEDGEPCEPCKYSQALELHLQNSEAKLRQRTVTVLGHLGEKAHPSHAAILAKRFQDEDPSMLAITAVALARMGQPGAEALVSQLKGEADLQQVACEALGRMANWRVAMTQLPRLTGCLQEPKAKRAVVEAIVRLAAVAPQEALEVCPALPQLLDWPLQDDEVAVRSAAAVALSQLQEKGVEVLVQVLQQAPAKEGSSQALKSCAALHGLAQCSDELCSPQIDFIVKSLNGCESVQQAAAKTLKSLGPKSTDSLARKLKSEDAHERELLVKALGLVGEQALPYTNMLVALLDAKNEPNVSVQMAAAEALGRCGPAAGKAAAVALAEFLSQVVVGREVAKQALMALEGVAAEVLPSLMSHQQAEVKCMAFDILESLGGADVAKEMVSMPNAEAVVKERAVRALPLVDVAMANRLLPKFMEDPAVCVAALEVMGVMGGAASEHAVLVAKQLRRPEAAVRRAAAGALCSMGPLPQPILKSLNMNLKAEQVDEVRVLLIKAVGTQGAMAGAFMTSLANELKEGSTGVQHALLEAFGHMGPAAAEIAPAVVGLLSAPECVPQVIQALGKMEEGGAVALSAPLEDPNVAMRLVALQAVRSLAELPATQEVVSVVTRLLEDPVAEVQGAACLTAAVLVVEQVKQELSLSQQDLEEQDKLYQLKVESGLARRRGKDQAALVARKLTELLPKAEVRDLALQGLWKLGAAFTAPHVEAITQLANGPADVRKMVFGILGDLGEHGAPFVELMVSHLGEAGAEEAELEVQLAVVEALSKLGMLGVQAAPALAKRLLGRMEDVGHLEELQVEQRRVAASGVAAALSPAEPAGMETRHGPRKSAKDYVSWQMTQAASPDEATSTEEQVQKFCVRALGRMELEGARTLTECLHYPDPKIQAFILKELRTVSEVHRSVIEKLEDAHQMVRQAVVEFIFHLAQVGKVKEILVPSLADEDPFIRHLYLQALGLLEDLAHEEAAEVAICLRDPSWSVRACAVRALHLIGPPAIHVLTGSLEDERGEVRAACMEGLGHLGELASSSAAVIVECLADEDATVLRETYATLQKIGNGREVLASCIASTTKPQVQLRAVDALGQFGKEAAGYAPVVAGLLGSGVKKLEETVVATLKKMGVPAASAVAPILVHPLPPVHDHGNMDEEEIQEAQKKRRLSASAALRDFGEEISKGQAPVVGQCLLDPDPEIRLEAVLTLKLLGESGAATFGSLTEPVTKLEARVLAIDALGKMAMSAMPWIPQLAKYLQEDASPEVRRSAALALGELADCTGQVADFAPQLAEGLRDGDALTRRRCIECLGKLGADAKPFVGDMAQILEGIDSWNWAPVAEALCSLGEASPAHADVLAKNLSHRSKSVKWSAAYALGKMGSVGKGHVEELVGLLKSEEASLRCVAIQTLMLVAQAVDLEEELLPLLSDPDAETREHACLAMASCREGMSNLSQRLMDPKPLVRRAAAASLGELGEVAAQHADDVLKLLFDANSYVCTTAARTLVSFGAEGARALMDRLLQDDEEEEDQLEVEASLLQRIMLDAIQAADAKYIEPYLHVLVVFLAANQPELRLAAWSCVAKVSDKGFQSLVKRANDPHIVVRKGVAQAIAFLLSSRESDNPSYMEREAMETLAQQLTDPSDAVRFQAAEGFRRIGTLAKAHVQDLAMRLEEHDIRVYCPVIDALGGFGAASAAYVKLLRARVEVPEWRVRASAVRALGQIGESAVLSAPLLVLRLEEDSIMDVKLCAVEALGRLGQVSAQAAAQIASAHGNCLASHMIMDEVEIRRACARTLGLLGPHACGCLHELVLALADSDLEVRQEASKSLTNLGEGVAPEIVAIIRSVEDTVDLTREI